MPAIPNPAAPAPGPAGAVPFAPPSPPAPSQTHLPGAFLTPLGVPTAVFELHPGLRISEEWTDNFFLSRRNREQNFRTVVAPGFTLAINGPRTVGNVSASFGLTYDTAESDENIKLFPDLSASIRHTFGPTLALTLTDSFVRNDDPQRGDAFGLRRERRTFTSNSFGASLDWALGLWTTQAYYRNSIFFEEEGGGDDTWSHVLGVNASRRLGALTTLRFGYEFSYFQSDRSSSNDRDGIGHLVHASLSRQIGAFATGGVSTSLSTNSFDDTVTWNVSLFGAYGLPTGLSLSGAVGYSHLFLDRGGDENTFSINASASYAWTRASVSVGVFQDFRQTFNEGQDFGIVLTRSYFAAFSYRITPTMGLSANVSYSENEPTGAGNVRQSDSSNTLTFAVAYDWQILRWLSMNLRYAYTDYSGFNGATENRATVSFAASF